MDARTLHALIPVALVAGIILSAYAGYESANPSAQGSCSVNAFVSCAKVAQSGHTTILGVQDWLIGLLGFVALLVVDIPLLWTFKREWLLAFVGLSTIGVGVSLYLAYVELGVIQALCLVCTGAYLSNGVAWVLGLALLREGRATISETPRPGAAGASTSVETVD